MGSSWSPNTCSSVWRSPLENVAYEFIFTSSTVSRMLCWSYLDGFRDGGKWPYSCSFVESYFQNLFNIAFLYNFRRAFSLYAFLVSMWCNHIVEMTRPLLGKNCVLFYQMFEFHMIDNLSISVHIFASRRLMSFSVDEILLPRYVNLSTSFREPHV